MTFIIMKMRFMSVIGSVMHTVFIVSIRASIEFFIAGGISGFVGTAFLISSLVMSLAGAFAADASAIAEEYRPGNDRTMSDEEVKAKLADISEKYSIVAEGIKEYEQE